MIRFLFAEELSKFPRLSHSMFRDRAKQFKERLKWEVTVDARGEERDQYDAPELCPLYVICEQVDGTHVGSMRFLPTTGRTMLNEHFLHLLDGVPLKDENIWECTRFCISEQADSSVAAKLMLAGATLLEGQGVAQFVAVFDAPMQRVYRKVGSSPKVLGSAGKGRHKTSVGLWSHTAEDKARLLQNAGVTEDMLRWWYQRRFGKGKATVAA